MAPDRLVPDLVPWTDLPSPEAAPALLGMAEGELRAELAGMPAGFECIALVEGGQLSAAALRIPPGGVATGRAELTWLCAGETGAALRLVDRWAAEAQAAGARTLQVVPRRAPGLEDALAAAGWASAPGVIRMRRGPAHEPGPLPAGVVERALTEAGLEALRGVWNASFAGVDFSAPVTAEELERQVADPCFDPALVRVLTDPQGPVAFLRGAVSPRRVGEVHDLGVLPRARRLGLGRWLLRRCASLLAEAGAAEVVLRVAESNATARQLYEADGWIEVSRARAWRRGGA